jgi:flagellin-like protein
VIDSDSRRGVSSVVGVILVVALVVILAGVVGTYGLGFVEDLRNPAPNVAESEGELLSDAEDWRDAQIVRLEHVAGDSVRVTDIEIVVEATACSKRSRIVNLPTNTLYSDNFEGDDIFSGKSPYEGELRKDADGTWTAGETIRFRLASGECEIDPGETLTIRIVHVPSNSIIVETTLTAS